MEKGNQTVLTLAVCDETSLASPDDYIPTDLFMKSSQVLQYRYIHILCLDKVQIFCEGNTNVASSTCNLTLLSNMKYDLYILYIFSEYLN